MLPCSVFLTVFSTPRGRLGFLASQTCSECSSREQVSGLSSLRGPSLSFGTQGVGGGSGMPGVILLGVFPIQGQPLFLAVQALALSPQAKGGGWVGRLSSRRAA